MINKTYFSKRTFLFSLSIISCFAFLGCKKGEDDPFLSLRSRKARLTGEWTLKLRDNTIYNGDSDSNSSSHYVYNEGKEIQYFTHIDTTGTNSYTDTVFYSETYTFEKDGTYMRTWIDTKSGTTSVNKGTWTFLNKNKENGLKNKEALLLTSNSGNSYQYTTTTETISGTTYQIVELRNKEITLYYNNSSTGGYNGSANTSGSSFTSKITLVKK